MFYVIDNYILSDEDGAKALRAYARKKHVKLSKVKEEYAMRNAALRAYIKEQKSYGKTFALYDAWTTPDPTPRWTQSGGSGRAVPGRKIVIQRKGYVRKAYTKKDGTRVKAVRVKPTTFKIDDPGKPGRRAYGSKKGARKSSPAWIKHEGALGGPGYTKKSKTERHKLLLKSIKRDGYAATIQRLEVLLRSTTMKPATKKILRADAAFLRAQHKAASKSVMAKGRAGGKSVQPGDRVTYVNYRGDKKSGRVVMRSSFPGSWVVNTGGRYGTPDVVDESAIVSIRKSPSGRPIG